MRVVLLLGVYVGTLGLGSCTLWNRDTEDDIIPRLQQGMRPVYFDGDDAKEIYSTEPRAIIDGAGLVILGNLLFIIDNGEGIHVIDNTDPDNPIPLSFIRILGVNTATADGNRLFTNNLTDLVTLDITDVMNVSVVDRDENLFPIPLDYPVNFTGYFECYDPALGILIRWEQAMLEYPECRR